MGAFDPDKLDDGRRFMYDALTEAVGDEDAVKDQIDDSIDGIIVSLYDAAKDDPEALRKQLTSQGYLEKPGDGGGE